MLLSPLYYLHNLKLVCYFRPTVMCITRSSIRYNEINRLLNHTCISNMGSLPNAFALDVGPEKICILFSLVGIFIGNEFGTSPALCRTATFQEAVWVRALPLLCLVAVVPLSPGSWRSGNCSVERRTKKMSCHGLSFCTLRVFNGLQTDAHI